MTNHRPKEPKRVTFPTKGKPMSFSQWCELVYDPTLRPSTDIRKKKEPVEWGGKIWTDRDWS